jgi:hypothetical protein
MDNVGSPFFVGVVTVGPRIEAWMIDVGEGFVIEGGM